MSRWGTRLGEVRVMFALVVFASSMTLLDEPATGMDI